MIVNNDTSITQQIKDAILAGRETGKSKALRRNPWQTLDCGMQFLAGLSAAYLELGDASHTTRQQRALRNLYTGKLRETSLKLAPEQLLEICGTLNADQLSAFAAFIFGTENGQTDEAAKIMQIITETRLLLPPFAGAIGSLSESSAKSLIGLGMIFGVLMIRSQLKKSFTWRNFIQATIQKDLRALQSWEIIMYSHASQRGFSYIEESEAPEVTVAQLSLDVLKHANGYLYGHPREVVHLPIPDHLISQLDPVLSELTENIREGNDKTELMTWFTENRENLRIIEQCMWEDIVQRPQYGLRSSGDRVKLDFPALQKSRFSRHESLVITPLTPFPRAQVRFLMYSLESPVSMTFTFDPDYFSWTKNWESALEGNRFVDELLYFIALEAYWTIVVGQSEPDVLQDSPGDSEEIQNHRERLRTTREEFKRIRPHLRRLPKGMQPSQIAAQQAEVILGITQLPPGKTFVHGYDRGWGSSEKLPITFTYKEVNLKSWI